jgi:hypothetical protein
MKTKVLFLLEKAVEPDAYYDVFAFFPEMEYNVNPNLKSCYAHIGQHSACHIDYAAGCSPATEVQYAALRDELESIGYELEILNV